MAKSTVITTRRGLDVSTQTGIRKGSGSSKRNNTRSGSNTRTGSDTSASKSKREGSQLAVGSQFATGLDESTETTQPHTIERLVSGGGEKQVSTEDFGMHVTFKVRFAKGFGKDQH